jgi:hypothetical protein
MSARTLDEVTFAPLNALAQCGYGFSPTLEWLVDILVRNFDVTIDGDLTSIEDLAEFFEPFFNTHKLQNQ